MSEDECISILLNHCTECDLREYSSCNECENKFKKAVQSLLDLYQKEKEKNKEIEIRLQEEINEVCEMKTRLFGNSISKNKIRAKIKEINNRRIEDGQCELALHGFQREAKIDVLTELLEEE